jgi:hypothetical protein
MAWFGWKPGRVGARPALSRAGSAFPAQAVWPQGYEAQVRAGYLGNAVAQRAVRLVAEGVGGAPLDGEAGLVALVGARGLMEALATQVLLHGNAFVQLLRDEDGKLVELFPLRPERVTVEPAADG